MLPSHVIEELLKRERYESEGERPQPELQLPLPSPPVRSEPSPREPRGVAIIPLWD